MNSDFPYCHLKFQRHQSVHPTDKHLCCCQYCYNAGGIWCCVVCLVCFGGFLFAWVCVFGWFGLFVLFWSTSESDTKDTFLTALCLPIFSECFLRCGISNPETETTTTAPGHQESPEPVIYLFPVFSHPPALERSFDLSHPKGPSASNLSVHF